MCRDGKNKCDGNGQKIDGIEKKKWADNLVGFCKALQYA